MRRPRLLLPIVLCAASVAMVGCGPTLEPPDERIPDRFYEVTVASHLANCVGVDEQLCMLLTEPLETDERLHYEGIVGFNYQWCSEQSLLVHDEQQAQRLVADGSSIVTILDSVEATEFDEGKTFALTLRPGWQPEIFGVVPYHCADGEDALCASVHETLGEGIEPNGEHVEATFICEDGNASPRLLSFEMP